jgi:glycosyltransferase involved in cell wall biosynthesis
MKVAWVTPFSQRSAIGRVSAALTRALAQRNHEVLIVRSEHNRNDSTPAFGTNLRIVWWQDVSPHDLELQNDVIVLNFGDNYEFHAGTLAFAENANCLGIFHDFYLYSFFNRFLAFNGLGEDVHEREVRRTYGESALAVAAQAWENTAEIEDIAATLPMTEWLGRKCCAALAHSRFYLNRLENSCAGPTAVAPLCFEGRDVAGLQRRSTGQVTITTIGVINANKCVDLVIRAVASSDGLRNNCRLRLIGHIGEPERARLENLGRDLHYEYLDILGEVDDETLKVELERADILSCLRKPVLEGASASAIEGMKSGRPIVVADAGFYADLPDDCVFKVPASIEISALQDVLNRLVFDEALRLRTGAKAREWAGAAFTTEQYVAVLEKLIDELISTMPLIPVGARMGWHLAELGITSEDPEVAALAKKMQALFGFENDKAVSVDNASERHRGQA